MMPYQQSLVNTYDTSGMRNVRTIRRQEAFFSIPIQSDSWIWIHVSTRGDEKLFP